MKTSGSVINPKFNQTVVIRPKCLPNLGFVSLVEDPCLPAEGEAGLVQGPEVDEALAHGDDGAALQGVEFCRNHCLGGAFGLRDLRNDIKYNTKCRWITWKNFKKNS